MWALRAYRHVGTRCTPAPSVAWAERHEVLQFAGSAAQYGAWLWRMHLPPQSEWTNARAHTALCAAVSSSERDRPSCATTIVLLPCMPRALNKFHRLERPWVEAHRSRSQGATTSDSAIFARSFSRGLAVSRSGVTGMACLPSLIACEDDVLSLRSRIAGCSSSLNAWLDV